MLLENQIAALATMVQDRMEQSFGELSPRAASVLLTLLNRGPGAVSWLADIVGVTQPTATRLVDGLEKQRLVRRAPREGRSVVVALTKKGRAEARRLEKDRMTLVRNMASCLTARDREAVRVLIDKLLSANTLSRPDARTVCRYCNHKVCGGSDCPVNRRAAAIEAET